MTNPLKKLTDWSPLRDGALAPAAAWGRRQGDWLAENDPVYRGWRKPGLAEAWASSVALGLIAVLFLTLALFDWNLLRGPVGRWASSHYDRNIVIAGDLDVRLFSPTPSLSISRLKVGGPAWARGADTLDVGRIDATVRLSRLLVGQIELVRLAITRPVAVMIVDQQGRRSWVLDPDNRDDEPTTLPLIQRLTITDGRMLYRDLSRDIALDARITARETAPGVEGRTGFHLDGKGTRNGQPLTLAVQGGAFVNIRRDRPYAFSAILEGAGSSLAAEGRLLRPFNFGRFDATLTLSGLNMADQFPLTGVATPDTPPYRLTAALTRDGDRWMLNDVEGKVGASDLAGRVEVDRTGERLRVTADLSSRSMDIDDLSVVLGAKVQSTSNDDTVVGSGLPGKLLPDAPLQVERLRAMDGTLSFRAASVKRNDFALRQVRLGAELQDGILKLNPVAFAFERGTLIGTARVDATKAVPYSEIDFRLAGYPVESVIPARGGAQPLTGRALGRARLEGPGASLHAFAAASKGTMSVVMPQGQMRTAFAELLGINAGRGLRLLLSGDQGISGVRCAVGDFTVAGGVATARTLVVDTDVVIATGRGTIDLGAETFDLRFDGETKKPRLLRVWAPVTIRGALNRPNIGIEGSAIAGQVGIAGILGALINPLVALLPFIDPGLAEDANCGALISGTR
ncbi:AsmA family protein [Brevundimonas variabilis]|uniref:AsmA domain-containing protein n=1 Tax=Brevundimonas variabilis TaxID=74312 RepID=A0A7W9CGL5_9CAUL|nr:AsmA family protein [Brevundimonas variabilis]MBB5745053.1 hypothetical protein [Brevundimonas variabilis]